MIFLFFLGFFFFKGSRGGDSGSFSTEAKLSTSFRLMNSCNSRSMANNSLYSSAQTGDIACPVRPALPVLPMPCI